MFQHTGQELADNLKVCMTAALKNYHDINKRLPERILVYRDGVGDGQVWKSNLGDSLLEALKIAYFQNWNYVAGNFRKKVLCLSYSTKPVCKGQLYYIQCAFVVVTSCFSPCPEQYCRFSQDSGQYVTLLFLFPSPL